MSEDLEVMDASNTGGVGAKHGFLYQDYAAAFYLLKMLRDKRLKAVRCEVTDDIDLIYDDYIEYVQVKSTDGNSKWNLKEFCATSPAKKVKGKKLKKPQDSILHKSLACDDKDSTKAKFRILTTRDVSSNLTYLRIERDSRESKPGKDKIITSLAGKLNNFTSPNNNDAKYWVENAFWHVVPSLKELELECTVMILTGAADIGVYIDPEKGPKQILNEILSTLTKKSATSKKTYTASEKSYLRKNFITWFEEEINDMENKGVSHKKIYSRKTEDLKPVLVELVDLYDITLENKVGMGLKQSYEKNNYRYEYIAKTLKNWIPELLLNPDEYANSSGSNFYRQFSLIAERLDKHTENIQAFIGRLLLHATIRYYSKSQPIPATLYIEDDNDTYKAFDNIHIVKFDNLGDELWMGFSALVADSDIDKCAEKIAKELTDLVSNDFTLQKEKILNIKQDNYLIKHDVNEILDPSSSLDDHKDRFRFVIFIGYESNILHTKKTNKNMKGNYLEEVIEDVKKRFEKTIEKILSEDDYFEEIKITIYIYPTPCIKTLTDTIEKELKEKI